VVSRETLRIALTLAGLNNSQVTKVPDIENAYITTPCTEKIWTVLGPKFGSDARKSAIVVHTLYVLKSAGVGWERDRSIHVGAFVKVSLAADVGPKEPSWALTVYCQLK
jgi:hypothetical protein